MVLKCCGEPHEATVQTPKEEAVRPLLMVLAVASSWLGLFAHNTMENVDGSTWVVALVAVLLLSMWRLYPGKLTSGLLTALGVINLVGGAVVSVLPLSFLPFVSEQSLTHYLAHLIYGLAQLPLLLLTTARFWKSR